MDNRINEDPSSFWHEVNAMIAEARADVAAGRVFDGEEVMNDILREVEEDSQSR